MNRSGKNRIHDWHKLKWPFTVSFVYYALISLYTGYAEASEVGFYGVLAVALGVDALVYFCYCYFLCRNEENMNKLWFLFIAAYLVVSTPQLQLLWQRMEARAQGLI